MGLEELENILRSVDVHDEDIRGADFEAYQSLNVGVSHSVAELVGQSGGTSEEMQACVTRLVDCGLIGRGPGDRLYVRPNGPYRLGERLRAQADATHARQHVDILALQNEMSSSLEGSLLARTAAPVVGQILDPEAAVRFVQLLVREARQEIAQISTGRSAGHSSRVLHEANLRAVRRGVRLRAIYPDTALRRSTESRQQLGETRVNGADVRVISQPVDEMIMLDRRVAVTMPSDDSRWIVRGDGLIQPLCALFDTYWELAHPPLLTTSSIVSETQELAPEERTLLLLLSRGLKDDAMANHLGVSVRTIRRRVSDLARQLGGTSRFQIGVLAERRGWLSARKMN